MKKTLVALAVLAASGAAMAQSTVTLYGLADVWVGRTSSTDLLGVKTSTTQMGNGGLNTSRWGLTGSEDLGGGLSAVFKFEAKIEPTTGRVGNAITAIDPVTLEEFDTGRGDGAFSRQSYVGLAGGFGTLTFSQTWTAMDDVIGVGASAFDSAFSAYNNVLSVNALYAANPGRTIKYASPDFGGFTGGFTYSMDNNDAVKEDITDFSLSYGAGPVAANFAYQVQGDVVGSDDLKLTVLNGTYDLGVAKLNAGFGQSKLATVKFTDVQFGVDVPLSSALTISGGYAQSKGNAAAGNVKTTGFGLAATYSLSKRTTAYTGYQQAKLKSTSVKSDLFAVGLRHTF
jgi:predicted porin